MKKIEKEIEYLLKNISGKVVTIGVSKNILKVIEKNQNITFLDTLDTVVKDKKKNSKQSDKRKIVSIHSLKRKYKKNKIDLLILNFEEVKKYKKTFIRDSIYFSREIIIYNHEEEIENLYKRYRTKTTNDVVLKIDARKTKISKLRNKYYYIIDTKNELLEYLTEFLTL